jgi:hypothetical protein
LTTHRWRAFYARMTRSQVPKRKADARPTVKLRGNRRPLAISLPPDLVDEIDVVAAQESRSRTSLIEVVMREYVRNYQRRESAA